MKKITFLLLYLLLELFLGACAPQPALSSSTPTVNLPLPKITNIPLSTKTPVEQPVHLNLNPAFSSLNLSGKLLLILYQQTGNNLIELDLQTGNARSIFQAPENSWLAAALASPDGKQILIAYTPPAATGEVQFGYTDLDLLPVDDPSQPVPFLTRSDSEESFFFPAWSPDGKKVYYTHLYRVQTLSGVHAYQNDVEAANLQGDRKTIADHAFLPAVSPDGSRISFLFDDPVYYTNDLYLANPDGSDSTPVFPAGQNPPIDYHIFTLDGNEMIFSMVNEQPQPSRGWLDRLLGVQVVSAHNVPSDWYRAPISGGTPQRITNLEEVNLNGDLSQDGSRMVFIGAEGLYVMNTDGSNLTELSDDVMIGTVDWIP